MHGLLALSRRLEKVILEDPGVIEYVNVTTCVRHDMSLEENKGGRRGDLKAVSYGTVAATHG